MIESFLTCSLLKNPDPVKISWFEATLPFKSVTIRFVQRWPLLQSKSKLDMIVFSICAFICQINVFLSFPSKYILLKFCPNVVVAHRA